MNIETENKAIKLARLYEKERLGLSDTAEIKIMSKGAGYDLESPDGRKIEVKGSEGGDINKGFVLNSGEEIDQIKSGTYIYRIINVYTKPELYILTNKQINISERRRADVYVPVALQPDAVETEAF